MVTWIIKENGEKRKDGVRRGEVMGMVDNGVFE